MTNINAALEETFQALIRPPFKQQRIGYFLSDGRSFRPLDTTLISQLQRNANIQAFGFGNEVDQNQLDAIDSDKAVILSDASELSTEFLKTTITRDDIDRVEITIEGESTPVRVIQPNELVDTPVGLSVAGSIDDLDVSLDAENKITAEVFISTPIFLQPPFISPLLAVRETSLLQMLKILPIQTQLFLLMRATTKTKNYSLIY